MDEKMQGIENTLMMVSNTLFILSFIRLNPIISYLAIFSWLAALILKIIYKRRNLAVHVVLTLFIVFVLLYPFFAK